MIPRVDAPTGDIVQDARDAMIARRAAAYAPKVEDVVEPPRADAEEGEVERAQREVLERRTKRFAV